MQAPTKAQKPSPLIDITSGLECVTNASSMTALARLLLHGFNMSADTSRVADVARPRANWQDRSIV